MLLVAQNERKSKPEVIAKAAVMITIYQKTMEISLVSYFLLCFLCQVRSALFEFATICTILTVEVEINIGTKGK